MGYSVPAWGLVLGMLAWAVYLYFAWSGVDALPMQWGLNGKPTWFASRFVAVSLIPALAILVVGAMTFGRVGSGAGAGAFGTAALLLAVQALWVFLARRYV